MENYKKDIARIYLVAGISLLLLTISFYVLGLRPLSERLRYEYSQESVYFLNSGLWVLNAEINKHFDLARQAASRTAIRNKQIDYLEDRISLEVLMAFSRDKLADAVSANEEIVGVARFDPSGSLLYSIGQVDTDSGITRCDPDSIDKITLAGIVTIEGGRRLVYCSPIFDPEYGRIGTDMIVFDDYRIQQLVNTHSSGKEAVMMLGIVSGGRLIYWPEEFQDLPARDALMRYIDQDSSEAGYLFRSESIQPLNWQLFAVINEKRFFADLDNQLVTLMFVTAGVLVVVFLLTILVLQPVISALLKEKILYEQATHDGLTGLCNHNHLLELLDRELKLAERHGYPLSALMFDIDFFKNVNDEHGHQLGDEVLQRIGETTLGLARDTDVAARYGGDEFFIVLPQTDMQGAIHLAERLRQDIAAMDVYTSTGVIHVSISVGVVCSDQESARAGVRSLIKAADDALYRSKNAGRDRITAVSFPG